MDPLIKIDYIDVGYGCWRQNMFPPRSENWHQLEVTNIPILGTSQWTLKLEPSQNYLASKKVKTSRSQIHEFGSVNVVNEEIKIQKMNITFMPKWFSIPGVKNLHFITRA